MIRFFVSFNGEPIRNKKPAPTHGCGAAAVRARARSHMFRDAVTRAVTVVVWRRGDLKQDPATPISTDVITVTAAHTRQFLCACLDPGLRIRSAECGAQIAARESMALI